jgi:hypothetical protein
MFLFAEQPVYTAGIPVKYEPPFTKGVPMPVRVRVGAVELATIPPPLPVRTLVTVMSPPSVVVAPEGATVRL